MLGTDISFQWLLSHRFFTQAQYAGAKFVCRVKHAAQGVDVMHRKPDFSNVFLMLPAGPYASMGLGAPALSKGGAVRKAS